MSDKVSVVMSIFNENEDEIRASVLSIVNQTYKNIEIIIVCDNPERLDIKKLINELDINNNIILLENKKNMGLALSLNKGIKNSSGFFIARMDADDISERERIEKQVQYMKKNKKIDLVTTSYNIINDKGLFVKKGREFNFTESKQEKMLYMQNFLIHPSWMIRKNKLIEIGGYRNFPSAQDYDFLLRLLDSNGKIKILPDVLINYRVRDKSISNSKGLQQYLLSKYIKKLSDERKENCTDSFSDENLINNIKVSLEDEELFNKCNEKFRNKSILFFVYLMKSKYYRMLFFDKIKFKLYTVL